MTHRPAPPPPQPPTPPSLARDRRPLVRRYGVEFVVVLFVLVFAAAVLVPTWLFGGFEQTDALPEIGPKQTVSYEEVKMTPLSATLQANDPATGKPGKQGTQFLVVRIRATNQLKDRMYDFQQLVAVGKPVFSKLTVTKTVQYADGDGDTLDPGLPATMQLTWKISASATVPHDLRLTLLKRSLQDSFFGERHLWKNPEPWVAAVLPVRHT